MYKPIPFFMSNRGYGMFVHTSAPATFDFGASYSIANQLLLGDDELDLFVFLGAPKEILNEYTNLTGKASMPPLWTFGLWMSRITYSREDEVRAVAAKLRENHVPADVIHLDTGWFETDWRCDYKFSTTRFKDPAKMMADLKQEGFHISLWQLPYFVPKNSLFPEIVAKGLAVRDGKGNLPYEDAVLDFTNPATVAWYQEKIAGLLQDGRGRDQGGFRRGRAADRSLCQRPQRVLRTQPVPAALQQGRGRHHPPGDRREHHLGAQCLGRQPALSAALGRRFRQHRHSHGGDPARRTFVRLERLFLLEP